MTTQRFLLTCLAFVCLGVFSGASQARATAITVMTYNIRHGRGMDDVVDLDRIAEVIRAENPDVVCLQEVDQGMTRTDGLDIPAVLAAKLGMNMAFGPNLAIQGGYYGNATLTPHPIAEHKNHRLPNPEGGEVRGCLHTAIEINGTTVHVFNTHWSIIAAERLPQASTIFELLPSERTILAGDLNELYTRDGVQLLLRQLQDSVSGVREGRKTTFGEGERARRIDYVLVSKDIRVLSAHVVDTETSRVASDHLPYVVSVVVSEPEYEEKFEADPREEFIVPRSSVSP